MNPDHINIIKIYLNNVTKYNIEGNITSARIECRKIFDYISLHIFNMRTNIKFIDILKKKLIDFESEKINNINIFYPLFYKKLLFPEEFGKLSYKEIKIFESSRDKYYQEDFETKKYFNKIQNRYNVYYRSNIYKIPEIVYI